MQNGKMWREKSPFLKNGLFYGEISLFPADFRLFWRKSGETKTKK
jgi:hypothetical protein